MSDKSRNLHKALAVQVSILISEGCWKENVIGPCGLGSGHGGHRSGGWASHLVCRIRATVAKNGSAPFKAV